MAPAPSLPRTSPTRFARRTAPARTLALALSLGPALIPFVARTAHAEAPKPSADKLGPEALVGEWWTEKKDGKVKFQKLKDGTYWGVLSWSAESPPRKDSKNPDPKLRDRLLVGIVLIWNLRYEDGEFVDGKVYNPNDGNTYRMKVKVVDPSTLTIRGYAALPVFGSSQTWTKVK